MDKKQRIYFIDNAKFIGIYLVIFGHAPLPSYLNNFIYTFHMPLFFVISGMLFSFEKHKRYSEFLLTRARQLLVPYFFFNVVTYLFWLVIGRKFGGDATMNISAYKPLIGMFYGNGIDGYLQHCTPLWFIICLFTVENIYYLVFRRVSTKYLLLIGFAVLGYIDYTFQLPRLPWGINLAFTAILFYGVGNLIKAHFRPAITLSNAVIAIGLLGVTIATSYFNGNVDMNNRIYNNYPMYLIGGFAGSFFLLYLAEFAKPLLKGGFVEYIAKNTIFVIAFQGIAGSLIRGFMVFVLKKPISVFQDAVVVNLIFSAICLLLILPAMYVISNYFPVVIGRTKKVGLSSKLHVS